MRIIADPIGQQLFMEGHVQNVVDNKALKRSLDNRTSKADKVVPASLSKLQHNRGFYYNVDQELNRVIIKIVDLETDTIIDEIPSEDMQKYLRYFDQQVGLLLDEKV